MFKQRGGLGRRGRRKAEEEGGKGKRLKGKKEEGERDIEERELGKWRKDDEMMKTKMTCKKYTTKNILIYLF